MSKYPTISSILIITAAALLSACGGGGSSGPKTAMTDAQFAELKANCNLTTARFGPSTTSETKVVDGVTMTIQETSGTIGVQIKISQDEATSAFACIHGEFERMGAEAFLSME